MSIDRNRPLGEIHDYKTVNTWWSFLPDTTYTISTTNPFALDTAKLYTGYNAHTNESLDKLFFIDSKTFLIKMKQPIDCCLEDKTGTAGCTPPSTKKANRIFHE